MDKQPNQTSKPASMQESTPDSAERLLAYLSNKLEGDDIYAFETDALDDSFLGDAADGFASLKNPYAVKTAVIGIQEQIKGKADTAIHEKTERKGFLKLAIAAGVFIVIGGIATWFFMRSDTDSQVMAYKDSSSIVAQEPIKPNSSTLVVADSAITDEVASPAEEIAAVPPPSEEPTTEKPITEEKEATAPNQPDSTILKKPESSRTPIERPADKRETQAEKLVNNAKPKATETAPKQPDVIALNEGMRLYQSASYKKAIRSFDAALNVNSGNEKATTFKGISQLKINDYNGAIRSFNTILKNSNSNYYEIAQWNKAHALRRKGRKSAAKKLFEEIASGKGVYSQAAAKQLE